METTYRQAFTEVIEILMHCNKNILEKIPNQFLDFLKKNMDKNYEVTINFNNENWEDTLKEETQQILALIYRDYIVSEEKRNELIKEEKEAEIKIEEELRQKYNTDNIFKKEKTDIQESKSNEFKLVEIKKESWYKKIYHKILKILRIKH